MYKSSNRNKIMAIKKYWLLLLVLLLTSQGTSPAFLDRHPTIESIVIGALGTTIVITPIIACVSIYRIFWRSMAPSNYTYYESRWHESLQQLKNGKDIVSIFKNYAHDHTKPTRTPLHYAENELFNAINITDEYCTGLKKSNPELSNKFKTLYSSLNCILKEIDKIRTAPEYAIEEMFLARNTTYTHYYPVHTGSTQYPLIINNPPSYTQTTYY